MQAGDSTKLPPLTCPRVNAGRFLEAQVGVAELHMQRAAVIAMAPLSQALEALLHEGALMRGEAL